MNSSLPAQPKLDLSFTRVIPVPRTQVWRAWTEPALLKPWFCPLPWKTVDCEIDLRPGGAFRTTMQSPEGQEFPNAGCYLQIVPQEKLVWTNALLPGFRPAMPSATCGDNNAEFRFTATIELADTDTDTDTGTRYTATVIHADEAGCKKHAAMGFEAGWGAALDQLVAMIQRGI
ncbi:MAG: polyketide cyclase [Burkholderiales bacterium PBB4]|nr:MAG: polyketide cyclase [Burkholderiales bacterium PBB4]